MILSVPDLRKVYSEIKLSDLRLEKDNLKYICFEITGSKLLLETYDSVCSGSKKSLQRNQVV